MPVRDVPNPEQVDISSIFRLDAGRVQSMTVSLVPTEYVERLYFSSDVCPLCEQRTESDPNRIPASINPKFEKNIGVTASVWLHHQCYEVLPSSDQHPPIPW